MSINSRLEQAFNMYESGIHPVFIQNNFFPEGTLLGGVRVMTTKDNSYDEPYIRANDAGRLSLLLRHYEFTSEGLELARNIILIDTDLKYVSQRKYRRIGFSTKRKRVA